MLGMQTALILCSLRRIKIAFQETCILTSNSSAQKSEQRFLAQIFNIKVKFIDRSFIHLWQGGERQHITKIQRRDAYKADVSETLEENICACYDARKQKPTNQHSQELRYIFVCVCVIKYSTFWITASVPKIMWKLRFSSLKRKYMCLDKSKINIPTSQNKEKVLNCFFFPHSSFSYLL